MMMSVNAHLARGFSTSFYFTVLLMVPVILFGQEIQNLGWSVSSWILLSSWIPLTLFLIGSVLPFYLGLFQHRHQARLMIAGGGRLDQRIQIAQQRPSRSIARLRPPPALRVRSPASGSSAVNSRKPRWMVDVAIPVARATSAVPP